MSFLYPYVLTALCLPLLLAIVGILSHRQAQHSWQRLVSPTHVATLVRRRPLWRTVLPATLGLLGLTFAILAAARPINGFTEVGAVTSGRNLIIALDVSRSMETTDVTPSRLEEARSAAYELINALPTDKIGLIVFSGEADLVVPLTYDHNALRETLYNVNRNWVATGGTNFGRVLQRAMQDFKRSAPDGTNALVILSDGEDTMDASKNLAREAKENNLLVITVGIGTTAGGAIPDPNGENGLWQDRNGKHVISKLDVARLREFALATGGDFFTMNSGTDLAAFARQAAEKLDRHEEKFSAAKAPNDLYQWFALPALLLVVTAILLATEWRRPARIAAALALLCLLAPQGKAADAENVIAYTQAVLLKSQGETDKAREMFSQALLDEDPTLQAAALQALGNMSSAATFDKLRALYNVPAESPSAADSEEDAAPATRKQPTPEELQQIVDELKNCLIPYQDALKVNPELESARKNIDKINEFIKKLEEEIERLKQQQQ
ncbi:MAG: VWA domain-containing protein, partial [Akkermansia sp.]|nr:VWA domain-containing protein [Akkermansia sp.]